MLVRAIKKRANWLADNLPLIIAVLFFLILLFFAVSNISGRILRP